MYVCAGENHQLRIRLRLRPRPPQMTTFLQLLQKSTSPHAVSNVRDDALCHAGDSVLHHLDSFSATHGMYEFCQDFFAVGHLFRTIPSSFKELLSLKIGSLRLPSTSVGSLREYGDLRDACPLSQYTKLEVRALRHCATAVAAALLLNVVVVCVLKHTA